MKWILDLNYAVQHLAFKANGQHIWAVHHDLETMMLTFVITRVFVVVESLVKNHWKGKILELGASKIK
jgi:uncharacterized membrane protein (DUF485 family)